MFHNVIHSDCLAWMRSQKDKSVNLVFGSPPYEKKRRYDATKGYVPFTGEAWVDWMKEVAIESLRICDGLVAFVVDITQKDGRSSCVTSKLEADMHRAGYIVRPDNVYYRVGVCGKRRDTFRRDHERIVCFSSTPALPWCEITADGWAPLYKPGGAPSNRGADGKRANQGEKVRQYTPPAQVNPGTVSLPEWSPASPEIPPGPLPDWVDDGEGDVTRCAVGGGKMGHPIAHEREAPFPLRLAARYVRTFCKPEGIVYDPFGGSGTTMHAAMLLGRSSWSTDVNPADVDAMQRRYADVLSKLGAA